MAVYHVYVLQSAKNNKRYVGYTSLTPEQRLLQHNRGCNTWTRHNRPFKLVYSELYAEKAEASQRERYLKSGSGRKFLNGILK